MALTKVTRSGITDDSINADKIEDGTIVDADITPGTITNAKLAGSIANAKLANSSITVNGSSVSLGGSFSAGAIDWQSVVTSDGSTVTTMVAGRGYFVDNTSAAGIVKLPASASAGDTIAIKDYAGNFGTNNLSIQRNSHKIQGVENNGLIRTNRASVVLVYIDATKGWLYTNESNVADLGAATFISATGGTITNTGNFRIHSFTGDGCFVVASVGNTVTPATYRDKVDYLVVAGGGGGGTSHGGGGGAGGYRESDGKSAGCYTASPLKNACGALTVTATTFPITVGAGGSANTSGSNSSFSTITSAGGGRGGREQPSLPLSTGANGGSGGGGITLQQSGTPGPGGSGNTPPVSPPQGNNGGSGAGNPGSQREGGGGGGASAAGQNASGCDSGNGGNGATTNITASPVVYAGGGAGGNFTGPNATGGTGGGGDDNSPGTANTGGGGGGCGGRSGGKGIVVIRYKYQ